MNHIYSKIRLYALNLKFTFGVPFCIMNIIHSIICNLFYTHLLYVCMKSNNMQTITLNPNLKSSYTLLKYTYGLVPIVAGLDKFTNLLTHWETYLPSSLSAALPFSPFVFMAIIGIIEIIAGLVVLMKPLLGAYIVMAWLCAIALVLLIGGQFDIAVRDLVMAVGAFTLAKLSTINS